MRRLTKPLLEAMAVALSAALAGDFEGGDFDGMDREAFERALDWVWERQAVRLERKR